MEAGSEAGRVVLVEAGSEAGRVVLGGGWE